MTSQKLTLTTSPIWCNFFVAYIQNNIIGSILEKRFSGYQLLAYYYVSWRLAVPEHIDEIGLDYKEEYDLAMKMTKI